MRLCARIQDMSRQKSEVEGRLRLADTQITELANTVRQKDAELQVGIKLLQSVTVSRLLADHSVMLMHK